MKPITLGILGMGTVASGLVDVMTMNQEKIEKETNETFEIKKVLVRNLDKDRPEVLSKTTFTTDPYKVINDPNIDILVELIGGIYPAYDYVKSALQQQKHVVTANKALIATHGKELESLAIDNGVRLMYEASVGGGIPIINTLSENLSGNRIESISGVINGTTNYVLTQMTERGLSFDEAVKEAQDLGFAEADPSSDVEGDDAAYKIAILTRVAYGQWIEADQIIKEGITKISKEDIKYARELGYVIKLLASSQRQENQVSLSVHPTLIPVDHPLATVKNEFNAVLLKGNATGEVMLYGKGAGALPTGSAVLSDIMAISKKKEDPVRSYTTDAEPLVMAHESKNQYYIRLNVVDKPGVLGYIANIFGEHHVSLASVVQRQKSGDIAPLVFITYETEKKQIDQVLEKIAQDENVLGVASVLTVENL